MLRYAVIALALLGASAGAAPLCRDSKGLFTPCPPGTPARRTVKAAVQAGERPDAAQTTVATATKSAKKPPLVRRAKLCRDSKGLFTPCPR